MRVPPLDTDSSLTLNEFCVSVDGCKDPATRDAAAATKFQWILLEYEYSLWIIFRNTCVRLFFCFFQLNYIYNQLFLHVGTGATKSWLNGDEMKILHIVFSAVLSIYSGCCVLCSSCIYCTCVTVLDYMYMCWSQVLSVTAQKYSTSVPVLRIFEGLIWDSTTLPCSLKITTRPNFCISQVASYQVRVTCFWSSFILHFKICNLETGGHFKKTSGKKTNYIFDRKSGNLQPCSWRTKPKQDLFLHLV